MDRSEADVSVKAEGDDETVVPNYHPEYQPSSESDIILRSGDETLFAVSSVLMKLTWGFFKAMFTLPKDPTSSQPPEPIPMQEKAEVIAGLLNLSFRLGLPPLDSMDTLETLLRAAEKYEVTSAVVMVRFALTSPVLEASPIRIYGIAYQRGWYKEATWASSKTLTLDLCSPESVSDLSRIDGAAVMKLMALHRKRRDVFRERLDDVDLFPYATTSQLVCHSCDEDVDNSPWQVLKYALVAHLERDGISMDYLDGTLLEAVVDAKCTRCKRKIYNPVMLRKGLREAIKSLPEKVEFSPEEETETQRT
ncbi:hypothetical protein FOMPIDRAFT_1046131 [Fomitopsis schrenkii]|uniref:BTB domain-containing protein n=1 Tax=Fomitopsis schrenkii TaxID=2126942 RepID=S8G1T1_FOMSC|nr:hypothetical protein FOMPIDRAFT_1046131 [Fomitopsis schrenkii]